ncbi:ABC transporter ATP-binding protein [Plasticicumulans sp.]|uniref:ABC transporter ATP-binding protein n=1 Tax=Plasticicumulans sp. TaxID=2307179 RepID=UPI000FC1B363|nr:ABC transporter ATP-binding protein [Plasticicumulans sp.]MBS0600921.1 ABC transporter ATP-binding protein [Pseudomonadota bacterium]RTL03411.1 MAG: ABC transporter ATP-binding protein [Xanthomonadales bacterium]HMV39044.1 ABC transporter ATP-binding protein [Plasticicumulans sp.]HMW29434.1 ABC transporter ATP-binding protein [Plasticicumulans sp.]HMW42288.1 ABC transporter ATP-binding protein [Plasticicumulans sp.]
MHPPALRIRQLVKTYRSGVTALHGIDLDVPDGDFFALLGPNGAGKSTTIGIVSSLVNKTAGRVEIFGHDLEAQAWAAKRLIGLVPQEFNFNQFEPVIEIVVNQAGYYGIPRHVARPRAEELLERLGLAAKARDMARELSGGMKRRLMIARALIHAPRLLILDEPTAGVDIELRRSMWEFLRETNAAGTTIILTTHYLEEAESLCRNIAIIDRGRLVEHTDMKSLLARLHTETFVLNLAAPLVALPLLPGYVLDRVDDTTLEVEVSKETGMNALFAGLAAHGIEVLSLRNKSNRLEELFIRLVESGAEARAAGTPA